MKNYDIYDISSGQGRFVETVHRSPTAIRRCRDRDFNAAVNIKNFGLGLNEALPSVRGKVKPAKQPPVDDRCPVQPKKQRCAEAGKAKVHRGPKPRSL